MVKKIYCKHGRTNHTGSSCITHTFEIVFTIFDMLWCVLIQRYLTAIRMYFTRWLIRMNSYDLTRTILYDLSKPQWRVGLGAGLGVGRTISYELATRKIRTI